MPDFAVAYWQEALAEMVASPTWKQIAERSQFTSTFMIGDGYQTFLAKTFLGEDPGGRQGCPRRGGPVTGTRSILIFGASIRAV